MELLAGTPFIPFGRDHVVTLLITLALVVIVPLTVRRSGNPRLEWSIAAILGVAVAAHELVKVWARITLVGEPPIECLPLHLCNLASFLTAYMLIRRSYGSYEIAYFWGMCGSLPAILTPDLMQGFPSLIFLIFFQGHGLVILGVIYATVVFDFRPTLRSVRKALLATLAYAVIIAPLNYVLGTNYLYLRHQPEQATLIDFLGPWPWYILSLGALAVIASFVCYLPFPLLARLSRRRS